MYRLAPERARQSFRHEALLYQDPTEFAALLVPFVQDALAADESVMVALLQEHASWLRDALGTTASEVGFVDMAELGRNPARIIPAWQEFLDRHASPVRPTRGIGEPIWAGRRDEEVAECQLHEALLNVAIDPKTPFWLVCPYDATRLSPSIISAVDRSHHTVLEGQSHRASRTYGGRSHVDSLFGAELPPLYGTPVRRSYTRADVHEAFALVLREAYDGDLWSDKALDLATSVRQLAVSSIESGASEVSVDVWNDRRSMVCQLAGPTSLYDALAGRRHGYERDRALWSANQLCDLVQLRSTPGWSTIRLHCWK